MIEKLNLEFILKYPGATSIEEVCLKINEIVDKINSTEVDNGNN